MFGLHGHSYFSHAPYAPRDVRKTSHPIGRFRWCSSAHLSQYLSPQTVSCRGAVSPWFTSGRPPSFQHSMSAPWKTFSGESPSFRATLRGTVTTLFRSASDSMFPMVLLLSPGRTAGPAAGFSRSTSGCGATEGRFQGRFRSWMQSRCVGSAFESQGGEELQL